MPENARKVFGGVVFDVYQWEQEMYDGTFKTFEKLRRNDVTNVLSFTTDGKVIVLEQEQPGKEKYFSMPGGSLEEGEEAVSAARRELMEETGYVAGKIERWHFIQPVSKIDYTLHFFVAKNCEKVADQALENGEKIKVHLLDFEEFVEMVFSEKLKSSEFIMKFFEQGLVSINKKETLDNIKKHFSI